MNKPFELYTMILIWLNAQSLSMSTDSDYSIYEDKRYHKSSLVLSKWLAKHNLIIMVQAVSYNDLTVYHSKPVNTQIYIAENRI